MALRISILILIVAVLLLVQSFLTGSSGPEAASLSELGMAISHAP